VSQRRNQVLNLVQRTNGPVGAAEVAELVGIHPNTARFHLEALVEDGILERVSEPPGGGRGRPGIGYQARPGLAKGGARRYRLLAEILLGHLATDRDPPQAARQAGRAWGAHLIARPAPGHTTTEPATDAAARLTAMLDEMDFAPEPVTDPDGVPRRIRLRHCPFLELADPHRDLVCALHLGLIQGALTELAAPITATDLTPFAEPAACLAHLDPTTHPATQPHSAEPRRGEDPQ
jgi:predicted ArsR family transcriptional regulator